MDRTWNVGVFLMVSLLLALPAISAVVIMDPLDLHMHVNAAMAGTADGFFMGITHLADGAVPAVLSVILLLSTTWRRMLMMALSTLLAAITVQCVKHFVFPDRLRPEGFLDRMPDLHLVPGVDLHHFFSFPSGHATAAFSMCFALTVLDGKKWTGAIWAVLAVVMAYSRVHLSQHFMADVLAGALLGTVVASVCFVWLYVAPPSKKTFLDRKVIRW